MDDPVLRGSAILVAAASGLAAIAYLFTRWVRPVIRGVLALGRKAHALDGLSDIAPAVQKIAAQFEGNGPSSIVGRLANLERCVEQSATDNTARFHAIRAAQADTDARIERIETKIGAP